MKSLYCGIICASLLGSALPPARAALPPEEPSIALLSKVILDVTRQERGRDWTKAKRGETLKNGDKVRTGEKSIAIIKFKDNSLVRVRERSTLTVTGTQTGTSFSKSVEVENGVVGFNVNKQRSDEEFRFTSPTSVASIRGTGGLFSSQNARDTLTTLEGTVRLTNKLSSQTVDVESGFTGVSNPDGSVTTHRSTTSERKAAEDANVGDDQQKRLEFDLRDGQGKTKHLHIDFKE
jgi:hypothetical protein